MAWSIQQDKALSEVSQWLKDPSGQQIFRLFGYAGTGKTTMAKHIASGESGLVVFAAFTGKAALVLRQKGCDGARTIHSLIYRPRDLETEEPSFILNEESDASTASLIIIDECSMVDEELGRDLLSFGKKVLVLGDPAQLPPIKGGGFFTEAEPDRMLTEVHRQAVDNPIIHLSMIVREGGSLQRGEYGQSRIISRDVIDAATVTGADQVLVGLNKTRRSYNKRMRALFGFTDNLPQVGDRLVCLRNDRKKGLLNGSLWNVKKLGPQKGGQLRLHVTPDDDPAARMVRIGVLPQFFEGSEEEIPFALRRNSDEFDYGYALTVHKAQGSQWDNVVLFDESYAFRENRHRWLYTGITRTAEQITIVM